MEYSENIFSVYSNSKHGTKARVTRFLVAGTMHFWETIVERILRKINEKNGF